eukprot:m.101812 g.101812  ORF g.101812 m.101812 type:complete len:488 (-) comp22309_c0_seq1:33-1496(-)
MDGVRRLEIVVDNRKVALGDLDQLVVQSPPSHSQPASHTWASDNVYDWVLDEEQNEVEEFNAWLEPSVTESEMKEVMEEVFGNLRNHNHELQGHFEELEKKFRALQDQREKELQTLQKELRETKSALKRAKQATLVPSPNSSPPSNSLQTPKPKKSPALGRRSAEKSSPKSKPKRRSTAPAFLASRPRSTSQPTPARSASQPAIPARNTSPKPSSPKNDAAKITKLELQIIDLKKRNKEIQVAAKKQLAEMTLRKQNLEAQLTRFRESSTNSWQKSKGEMATLTKQVAALQAEKAEVVDAFETFKAESQKNIQTEKSANNSSLTRKIETLEAEVSKLQAANTKLTKEVTELRAAKRQLPSQFQDIQSQLTSAQEVLSSYKERSKTAWDNVLGGIRRCQSESATHRKPLHRSQSMISRPDAQEADTLTDKGGKHLRRCNTGSQSYLQRLNTASTSSPTCSPSSSTTSSSSSPVPPGTPLGGIPNETQA